MTWLIPKWCVSTWRSRNVISLEPVLIYFEVVLGEASAPSQPPLASSFTVPIVQASLFTNSDHKVFTKSQFITETCCILNTISLSQCNYAGHSFDICSMYVMYSVYCHRHVHVNITWSHCWLCNCRLWQAEKNFWLLWHMTSSTATSGLQVVLREEFQQLLSGILDVKGQLTNLKGDCRRRGLRQMNSWWST